MVFTCEYCLVDFEERNQLLCHKQEDHAPTRQDPTIPEVLIKTEFKYDCNLCHSSIDFSEVEEHLLQCNKAEETIFKCKVCPIKFETQIELTDHEESHLGDPLSEEKVSELHFDNSERNDIIQPKIEVDDDCENQSIVDTSENLQEQIGNPAKRKRSDKEHKCLKCEEIFKTKAALNQHIKFAVDNVHLMKCFCGERFKYEKSFRQHVQSHLRKNASDSAKNKIIKKPVFKYTCEICSEEILGVSNFQRHLKEAHPKPKPKYTCKFCNFETSKSTELTKHSQSCVIRLNSIKSTKIQYDCQVCKISFDFATEFYDHIRQSSDDHLIYDCNICLKKFKFEKEFKAHERKHQNQENWTCKYCFKGFMIQSNFEQHVKESEVRQEDGPLVCKSCHMEFIRYISLKACLVKSIFH